MAAHKFTVGYLFNGLAELVIGCLAIYALKKEHGSKMKIVSIEKKNSGKR